MKELLVLAGMIMLGVFMALTLILGEDETSMKSSTKKVGEKMISDMYQSTDDTNR